MNNINYFNVITNSVITFALLSFIYLGLLVTPNNYLWGIL